MINRAANGMRLIAMGNAIIVYDADLIRMHPPDKNHLQEGEGVK